MVGFRAARGAGCSSARWQRSRPGSPQPGLGRGDEPPVGELAISVQDATYGAESGVEGHRCGAAEDLRRGASSM